MNGGGDPGLGKAWINNGAHIDGVSIGTDVPGINYEYEYETIGVTNTNWNLRLPVTEQYCLARRRESAASTSDL